jgi:peptidoglycan/LPS O-acetylase OafA/YrhL
MEARLRESQLTSPAVSTPSLADEAQDEPSRPDANLPSRSWGLDALRGAAILLVMARHYPSDAAPAWLRPIASIGWSGVDLFFVLSGFLITRQLLSGMSMAEFYVRRVLRILPPYWVALVLYFGVPGFAEARGIAPLWKFVLFVQNLGLDPSAEPAFSHAWSLCIEEHFYLIFCPLIVLGYQHRDARRFLALLGAAVIGEAIVRSLLWTPAIAADRALYLTWIYYPTPTHLDGLVMGAALAVLEARGWLIGRARALLPAGALVLAFGYWLTGDRQTFFATAFGFAVISVGYSLLVAGALRGRQRPGRILETGFSGLAWLAYPAYLIHKPILRAASSLGGSPTLNVMISLALTLVAASAVHFAVERPSLALRQRLVRSYRVASQRT